MVNKIILQNLKNLGIYAAEQRVTRCFKKGRKALVIEKKIGDSDITLRGAVPERKSAEQLYIRVNLPRRAGATGVNFLIKNDNGSFVRFPLSLSSTSDNNDCFKLKVPIGKLPCGLSTGLYYYSIEICFGSFSLFANSINNADYELLQELKAPYKLLVYSEEFDTPEWFRGNIMYHAFVDRFFKGSVPVPVSETAVMNFDWENGIPEYGEYPGAFVKNNMFFGGTLYGICEKLDYLESLGVGCIYLSPIFRAYSNHKYDACDYMTVDEMFGGEEALKLLISESSKRGIRIILDGVFNHTGDDSIYFNRYKRYGESGAYNDENSQYRDWYYFYEDKSYEAWWGIEILPKLNLSNPDCRNYFLGQNGVLEKYLDMGIGGVRLDVADELPDDFLDDLRRVVKSKTNDAVIIGEVWENAIDKVSYGERRRYFQGSQLDSVMNYPLKNAIIDFVKQGNAEIFYNTVTELYSCYPSCCSDSLMNIVGTHDTERILTVLGGENPDGFSNTELALKRISESQKETAVKKLKLCSVIQYTLFGVPSLYYGDEAGLEGYHDPFCRMPFPWGRENAELLSHYRLLGKIRRAEKVFERGEFEFTHLLESFVGYRRFSKEGELQIFVNAGENSVCVHMPASYVDLISLKVYEAGEEISVCGNTALILKKQTV